MTFLPLAEATTQAASQDAGGGLFDNPMIMLAIYAVLIGGLYFFLIRPNSKKKKAEQEMKSNLQIGDDVTTIGGIVGRIVAIKEEDDEFIVESGADKVKLKMKRWAISTINTEKEQPQAKANNTNSTEKKGFFSRFSNK